MSLLVPVLIKAGKLFKVGLDFENLNNPYVPTMSWSARSSFTADLVKLGKACSSLMYDLLPI